MKTAIYARQSIEKQDSVSIEAQVEKCRLICTLNSWEYTVYSDAGYSGSNINRPGFEKLINDVNRGNVNRVIAYRLDRISRSLTDFANLLQLFEKHNVQFRSATEEFDTSSPIGRAMVYIVMVFAQLERETITQRITDNYYFRAKQGLFTGGNCPLGYRSTKVDRKGKNASVLEVDPEASEIVKSIYGLFTRENYNANRISLHLNEKGIRTQKGSTWTRTKVIRVLKNPAYAPNDMEVYEYLQKAGYKITNPPGEFNGAYGLGIFGKERGSHANRKYSDPEEQVVAIGLHPPIIDSSTWLDAQYRLAGAKAPSRSGTSQTTWLSGMLSCGVCGHSMSLKYTKKGSREYRYIYCRGRSSRGSSVCGNAAFISCRELENFISDSLYRKINDPGFLEGVSGLDFRENTELLAGKNTLLMKVYGIDAEIKNYLENIGRGNSVIDRYITEKITALDAEKANLLKEIDEMDMAFYNEGRNRLTAQYIKEIIPRINNGFGQADIMTKQVLASALIQRITIDDKNTIKIKWNI